MAQESFRQIIDDVIDLAEQVCAQASVSKSVDLAKDDYDPTEMVTPAWQELRNRLEGLDQDVVLKLRTLMYAGRDGVADIAAYHQELSGETKEAAIAMMMEKPLHEYLREGLRLADENGSDLEASW